MKYLERKNTRVLKDASEGSTLQYKLLFELPYVVVLGNF